MDSKKPTNSPTDSKKAARKKSDKAKSTAEAAPAAADGSRKKKPAANQKKAPTRKQPPSKQKAVDKTEGRQKNSSKPKTSSSTSASEKSKNKSTWSNPKTDTKATQNKGETNRKSASSTTWRNFSFAKGEFVVYPPHGVGKVLSIAKETIAGSQLEMLVIDFERDKLTLRIPLTKLEIVGLRKLSEKKVVQKAMETLRSRAQVKRTMWSRRSQEYNAKINSGDLISIAEVTRDLFRPKRPPEQSYSERQIYEMARDRIVQEIAIIQSIEEQAALEKVENTLQQAHGSAAKKAG